MAELLIQALKSILAHYSPSSSLIIKNDSQQDLALSACGKFWKLFLDLNQCKQHYRQCEPTASELHRTRAYIQVSYDVERDRFGPNATVHISNEGSCDQQSVELLNEPITLSTFAFQSPVEINLQPSGSKNFPRTLEQTSFNGQANQPITGVNESSTQHHSKPKVKEDQLDVNLKEVNSVHTKTPSRTRVTKILQSCPHCFYKSRISFHMKQHIFTLAGEKTPQMSIL